MNIADQIRTLRVTRQLTLAQVAEGTGLSLSYLSDLERGRTKPSLKTLEILATFHGSELSIEFIHRMDKE